VVQRSRSLTSQTCWWPDLHSRTMANNWHALAALSCVMQFW